MQVTCRAIGIGAYLVRLGQRVIQVENSHIILTGAGALNKVCLIVLHCTSFPLIFLLSLSLLSRFFQVLGREVYSSNTQLGGIQIMYNNGRLDMCVDLSKLSCEGHVIHFLLVLSTGVTHETVSNDLEGVSSIINWLSFVPKVINAE